MCRHVDSILLLSWCLRVSVSPRLPVAVDTSISVQIHILMAVGGSNSGGTAGPNNI